MNQSLLESLAAIVILVNPAVNLGGFDKEKWSHSYVEAALQRCCSCWEEIRLTMLFCFRFEAV